jgi:hypothetical protein
MMNEGNSEQATSAELDKVMEELKNLFNGIGKSIRTSDVALKEMKEERKVYRHAPVNNISINSSGSSSPRP